MPLKDSYTKFKRRLIVDITADRSHDCIQVVFEKIDNFSSGLKLVSQKSNDKIPIIRKRTWKSKHLSLIHISDFHSVLFVGNTLNYNLISREVSHRSFQC